MTNAVQRGFAAAVVGYARGIHSHYEGVCRPGKMRSQETVPLSDRGMAVTMSSGDRGQAVFSFSPAANTTQRANGSAFSSAAYP